MSSLACRLTGNDWMKAFISHLLQKMSHSQWIFRNYTLHDKQWGYLRLCLRSDTLREISELLETPPSNITPQSQYLLELDHSSMYNARYEDQAYWVLALKAARCAGRQAAVLQRSRGRSQHNRLATTAKKKTCYDFSKLVGQMGYKLRQQATTRKWPHTTSVSFSIGSNKWLRKPD
jgi:hypothetical protein